MKKVQVETHTWTRECTHTHTCTHTHAHTMSKLTNARYLKSQVHSKEKSCYADCY